MKEFRFKQTHSESWIKIENALKKTEKLTPDEMAEYYITLSDDYAYAQTYYPGSPLNTYLGNLITQIHINLYKNKKQETSFIAFWKYKYPTIVYNSRKEIFFSILILIVGTLVGWYSSIFDPNFKITILGEEYIYTTMQNIAKHAPMAIYKTGTGTLSFLGITFNNIKVALLAFVGGASFGYFTLTVVFFNAVMLGTFLAIFKEMNILNEAISIIFIHGTLEIFSITIAAAAGFIIAQSLLFPQSLKRLESFKLGVQRGGRLCFGVLPLFVIAGFLEGYITRLTQMPYIFRYAIIGISIAIIIFYFLWYPFYLNKKQLN
jgi:Uncharacterized membrane protein